MEKLRKWAKPSDLTAISKLKAELSNVRTKKDSEVLSIAYSVIKHKYEDVGISVDKIEVMAELIAAASKDCLSSINT